MKSESLKLRASARDFKRCLDGVNGFPVDQEDEWLLQVADLIQVFEQSGQVSDQRNISWGTVELEGARDGNLGTGEAGGCLASLRLETSRQCLDQCGEGELLLLGKNRTHGGC